MDTSTSHQTSATDPHAQRSRVFIGNLNTAQMSRGELEQKFSNYGHVTGVSVHKGYGFVQYNDEWTARTAAQSEDGQVYYGMRVDVNIASEPKQKRVQTGRTWGQPATKRARPDLSGPRKPSNLVSLVTPTNPMPEAQSEKRPTLNDPTVKDLLVCGNCKDVLDSLEQLTAHKVGGCRLRLVCRCRQTGEPLSLDCASCGIAFFSSWELLLHCKEDHDLVLAADGGGGGGGGGGSSRLDSSSEANGSQ